MKTFKNAIGWSVLSIILFASCKKEDVSPPVIEDKPQILADTPEKGWYGSNISGWFSVTGAESVSVTPGSVSGNNYTVSGVTSTTMVVISATNKAGTVSKTIPISVWSERTTYVCSTGLWKMTQERFSSDSLIWNMGIPTCLPTTFNVSGKCTVFQTVCGGTFDVPNVPWSFNSDESGIKWGTSYFKTIISLSPTKMVLRWKNPSPSVTQWVEETFEH